MRKEASLPVRLNPDEKRRLQEIADQTGTTVSALIRLLVRSFVEDYERGDGHVSLPPDWRKLLTDNLANAQKAAENTLSYLKRKPRLGSEK